MAIPSRVLGSGVNSLSTVSICGDGNASVSAAGTSAGNATAITFVYNNINGGRLSIFKPSGLTWRLGKCDPTKDLVRVR